MEERRERQRDREKGVEHTRKCYRPTGGWAMRVRMLVSYKIGLV